MYKIIVSTLCLLVFPILAGATALTLEQCLERGMQYNPQLEGYRLAVEEAEEGIYEAWGAFLPTLSADYSYANLENSGTANLDRDYLSSKTDTFQARLSQPLFTGMAGMAGLKKARESQAFRENEYRLMRQQLVREVRTSFYNILLSKQLVNKWIESVGRLENQEKIAKAWVAQELAPRLRLLEIAVELSNARQSLVRAETTLAISRAKLKEWLALQPDEELTIDGHLPTSRLAPCDAVEVCLDLAFDQRPELKLAELNIAMGREDLKMIRARNLPSVSFDAGWVDFERKYDDRLDKETRDYYTLALNVSVRPFQGGRNIFAYRRQMLNIKRYEHELSSRKNGIVTEVRTRFQELLEGESRFKTATKGVEEATEAYNIAVRSAKLGVLSLEDLLTTELRLTQAEINKITAEFTLQQGQVQLDFAVGNPWLKKQPEH